MQTVDVSWFTSLLNRAMWNVPEQMRVLWRIPIRDVIEAMGRKFEEVQCCEFEHDHPWKMITIEINELANDWQFVDDEELPYDFFEVKTTIDLVMFLDKEHTFESAVKFLLEKFPAYRLPDVTER